MPSTHPVFPPELAESADPVNLRFSAGGRPVKRMSIRTLLISALAPVITQGAMAEVVVGTCRPNLQAYTTITQAVSTVGPGSTILVCPGTYPEQITITQPLTLRGIQSENAANPVVTVPSGGLTQSIVAPTNGVGMVFQVLVLGTESGLVNISNIAVDGGNSGNGVGGWFAGIYYQNSSGAVRNVATYGQSGNGYGFGIFLEGTTPTAKTVTVSNSSVHDFDSEGIRTNGSHVPNLTVNIESNLVISSTTFGGNPVYGEIDVQGAVGSILNNQVITHPAPPGISAGVGIAGPSNMVVSNNMVVGTGIWLLGDSNTIKANRVSFGGGITISGHHNTVQYNSTFGAGISFNCTGTLNTVTNNVINDSYWGILDDHGNNIISPNSFSNVTKLISPPC